MHLTPDSSSRKVVVGMIPSPSPCPFFTPRPERRRPFDANLIRQDKDREVNIQVLLRCRPLNDDEQRLNIPKVISCNEHKREITVLQSMSNNKLLDRSFTFDKVFGPKAHQRSIYHHSISPIVDQVLEGFNCTVFAYGQTGTGKTYTMEGQGGLTIKTKGGDLPAESGVIPRAVAQIFDTLEAQKADYSIKVTFFELYNEEITDLLAPIEDKPRKPISLMEDGKGGVTVRGLEEAMVYSANEIYNLLERGSSKRRTVDTLLNKHSSRSHAVFSITIHVKEATIGDEELIKCGKLNLVDLAGSENISRSGAREGRAREAGEINKSLLTLGRVINALVEHSAHIPYRDSKLTRLLRDSLGGKTKTCIIATISPSLHCLEETLSTLDYAYRAKNIKNKPEAIQKMSKAILLRDLYLEMERMKQEVRAAREKNGIYIPHERFAQDEADKKAMKEKIEQLEIDLDFSTKQADKYQELYLAEQEQKLDLESELREWKNKLENCNKVLQELQEKQRITISTLKEKEFIISNLLHSESTIFEHAKELRENLHNASEDITLLFCNLDQKNKMESDNHGLVLSFGSQLNRSLKNLHRTVLGSVADQQQHLRCMEEYIGSFLASKCDASKVLESRIENMKVMYSSGIHAMKDLAEMLQKESSLNLDQIKSAILVQTMAVEDFLEGAVKEFEEVIEDIHSSLDEQKHLLAFSSQQQEEGLKRSLVSAQVISNETMEFFNDLHRRFSTLMKIIDETQIEKSQQLAAFGKTFKEESLIEEKLALENIAKILGTLTSKKTDMVAKALKNMDMENIEVKERLEQEMFDVQKVSSSAIRDWNEYWGTLQCRFVEETFSAAENQAIMENIIHECSKRVDDSRKQWENTLLSVNHLNKDSIAKIGSMVKEKVHYNHGRLQEIGCLSSSTCTESDSSACELLEAVNNSLQLDHEMKEEIDSVSILCSGQLKQLQEKHGKNISNIRNRADQCLTREYKVEHVTSTIPAKREIGVPSVQFIEGLRAPAVEDLLGKLRSVDDGSKSCNGGSKVQHQLHPCTASPNRTPFAALN